MTDVKFGTDGWRGVIADDYTFETVRAVAQATAEYVQRHDLASRGVVVGYDTRFLSGSFAGAVAEVLAGNGIAVALSRRFLPTPALSYAVREREAGLGVMITASHNPARWNGFKVKPDFGGSAPSEVTAEIEQAVPSIITGDRVRGIPLGEAEASGLVERIDARTPYVAALRDYVDIEAIRGAGLSVAVDPMYGASMGLIAEVLGEGATHIHEIHGSRNPSFPGMRAPEPIASNLTELLELVGQNGYNVGLAMDGDGDRFGLVDENGQFITQLQSFALMTQYFLKVRGDRGAIVRSVTMSRMVDRLGDLHGCEVHETMVGFKHLGPRMMELDALIAGEESGGYAFRGHIPERDGVLTGLLMLDFLAKTERRPSQLLEELYAEIGRHEYDRVDVTIREDEREAIRARIAEAGPDTIAGLTVESRDEFDGFRFTMEGGWWLLLRFSGTEPLLRIYAEMPSLDQVHDALHAGQEIAGVTL